MAVDKESSANFEHDKVCAEVVSKLPSDQKEKHKQSCWNIL